MAELERVLYVDTSAVLRAVLESGASPDVEQALREATVLVTSRLSLVESQRAVFRLRREGSISESRLADAERELGRAYLGVRPSRKSVQRVCRKLSELTGRRWTLLDARHQVARINRVVTGWSNYFCLGPMSMAHRGVDAHAQRGLRQWLRAKHRVRGQGFARFPNRYLYEDLGLARIRQRARVSLWANA